MRAFSKPSALAETRRPNTSPQDPKPASSAPQRLCVNPLLLGLALWASTIVLAAACDSLSPVDSDTASPDLAEVLDVDALVDLDTELDLDAAETNDQGTEPDQDATIDEPPIPPECPHGPGGTTPAAGRWSLSVFHFNVQYVAGGLEGFARYGLGFPGFTDQTDISETEAEDRIIVESMAPLLGVLERNPSMALTLEMQGLMVDIIRERQPDVLARMRALNATGQLELASIHWSDQFFLAFGREDMDESWRRTKASFDAAGLVLSPVVFTQEGQFGEGFAAWLKEVRPDAVMIMARNLQGFYQADLQNQPYFQVSGLDVVLPRSLFGETVDLEWNFFDDGELLATNNLNPYAGKLFVTSDSAVQNYEFELQCAEQRGFRVGRVSDYLDAVKATGATPAIMPPFVDGTWQPGTTRGPLRWLGGGGDIWARQERDNQVLTTCFDARDQVLALQTLVDRPPHTANATRLAALDHAWRELLLGEVSDARGVNPWFAEIEYGLRHCRAAAQLARRELLRELFESNAAALQLDVRSGDVVALDSLPAVGEQEPSAPEFTVEVVEDGGRDVQVEWFQVVVEGQTRTLLQVDWPAVDGAQASFDDCLTRHEAPDCYEDHSAIAIQVPRTAGLMAYRPALGKELVRYTEADFVFSSKAYEDAAWSPLPDGLIDLGSVFLVQDHRAVHLAAGWPAGEGRNGVVEFRDETLPPQDGATWRFWVTGDETEALEWAERNLRPLVIVVP